MDFGYPQVMQGCRYYVDLTPVETGDCVVSSCAKSFLATGVLALAFASTAVCAAAADRCDRNCLEGMVDRYLAAMIAHDAAPLPMAADVKYTENQDLVRIGEGIWHDAQQLGTYKIYAADTERGQIGFMGAVKASGSWTMIALRLRVIARQIVEVETVLPGRAANAAAFGFGDAAARLTTPRAAFAQPLEPSERRDRSVLINAADLHYEGVERGNGDIVPFSDECVKIENGLQLIKNPNFAFPAASPTGRRLPNFAAMGCRDQFNTHIWDTDSVTDRRYPVVDMERGIVMTFVMYDEYAKARCADVVDYGLVCPPVAVNPLTLVLAEAFKIRNGEIHEVEAVFTALPGLRLRGLW
jgi:hypothetical protein